MSTVLSNPARPDQPLIRINGREEQKVDRQMTPLERPQQVRLKPEHDALQQQRRARAVRTLRLRSA